MPSPQPVEKFYKRFSEIKDEQYDGFIVTGAPIEHLPFEQVGYWGELTEFFDRMKAKDEGLLSLCWGAMATRDTNARPYTHHSYWNPLARCKLLSSQGAVKRCPYEPRRRKLNPFPRCPVYHFQKVPKYIVPAKLFGCFNHDNMYPKEVMMQGIPDHILIPVSRHTTWKSEDFIGKDG